MTEENRETQIEAARETDNLVLGVSELICELLEQHARDSGEESLEVP